MHLLNYFNPEIILLQGGLWVLILIVFLESGCFFGFFLPGDSLLFTAGLLCGTGIFPVSLNTLITGLCIAAVLGYIVGYFTGKLFNNILKKGENRFFKKHHLDSTNLFYRKYGIATVIFGRFIPIVRTFAPILAGMVYAPFGRFMIYNIIGALIWVIILVYSGFWIGSRYPFIKDYLEFIIIGIIIISAIPAINNFFKKRKSVKARASVGIDLK